MRIRRLDATDARSFQALRLFALQQSPSAFGSSFEEEQHRSIEQVVSWLTASPERVMLGAFVHAEETSEQLVGIAGVGRETALKERHRGFIRSMFVSPQYRGQGLAAALLQHAMAVATEWPGLEQLTLAVTAGNAAATAVYAKAGFVEVGRAPRALCVDGAYYDELQMVWLRAAT